ncbi:MAG: hypothetical protein U1E62_22625 [Alsobacter sp.]
MDHRNVAIGLAGRRRRIICVWREGAEDLNGSIGSLPGADTLGQEVPDGLPPALLGRLQGGVGLHQGAHVVNAKGAAAGLRCPGDRRDEPQAATQRAAGAKAHVRAVGIRRRDVAGQIHQEKRYRPAAPDDLHPCGKASFSLAAAVAPTQRQAQENVDVMRRVG